jgi:hypothetical protein
MRIELAQKEVGREYLTGNRDGLRCVVELRVEIEALQSALELLAADQSAAEIEVERAKAAQLRLFGNLPSISAAPIEPGHSVRHKLKPTPGRICQKRGTAPRLNA